MTRNFETLISNLQCIPNGEAEFEGIEKGLSPIHHELAWPPLHQRDFKAKTKLFSPSFSFLTSAFNSDRSL